MDEMAIDMNGHLTRKATAIDTGQLGALIAERRNALLCELLQPMLATLEQEGIQFSAVLGALGTIADTHLAKIAMGSTEQEQWQRCCDDLHRAKGAALAAERSRLATTADPQHHEPDEPTEIKAPEAALAHLATDDPDESWADELLAQD